MDKELEKTLREILREHQNDLNPPERVTHIKRIFELVGMKATEKTDIKEALKPEKRKKPKIVDHCRLTVKRQG